jgi:hypothetical protein
MMQDTDPNLQIDSKNAIEAALIARLREADDN